MDKIFYIEAVGLAENKDGSPALGAMSVDFGVKRPGSTSYEGLIAGKDPEKILRYVCPWAELSSIRFITPEEFVQKYGGADK
jgi:hypothetical protein